MKVEEKNIFVQTCRRMNEVNIEEQKTGDAYFFIICKYIKIFMSWTFYGLSRLMVVHFFDTVQWRI